MERLFQVWMVLCECFLVQVFFQGWSKTKAQKTWVFWLSYALCFLVGCCTRLSAHAAPRAAVEAACVFLLGKCLYRLSAPRAFWSAAVFTALALLSDGMAATVLRAVGLDPARLTASGTVRLLCGSFSKLIELLAVLAASMLGRGQTLLPRGQVLALIPCQFICQVIGVYVCHVLYTQAARTGVFSVSLILVLMGLLYLDFMMVFLAAHLLKSARLQQRQVLTERQLELQEAYYEQVRQDQKETHSLWHDMKKYMMAMQAMVEAGNSAAATAELARIQEAVSGVGGLVDVGNAVLNAILNYGVQRANSAGVKIQMEVSVPSQLSVSAVDLSVILGNTIDNAIEASQALPQPQRVVRILLCQRNDMLFYAIENFCAPVQRKKEGKTHGYGLPNVLACVDKYQGNMTVENAGGRFSVSIRLNARELP